MKLCSITVSSNREAIIGEAIDSVAGFVDAAVLVDLGITDKTKEIIESKLHTHSMRMSDSAEMGDMRNAGLRLAMDLGFDWASIVDTDERILPRGIVKAFLSQTKADVILCPSHDQTYNKERFIRLNGKCWYKDHIHEAIEPKGLTFEYSDVVRFYELPKSPEVIKARSEAIIEQLSKEVDKDPTNSRHWLHIAEAESTLNHKTLAMYALTQCIRHTKKREEAAYACVMAAHLTLNNPETSIRYCVQGLGSDPRFAECACIAAFASLKLGDFEGSIYWANMALANGRYIGIGSTRPGQAWPIGLWEGPYLALEQAYRLTGAIEKADEMKAEAQEAEKARLAA